MSAIEVDLDLIRKYNVPGPRYTSYPPATQFTSEVPAEAVAERVRRRNAEPHPLSLYVHIPFCESLCWFCGCTTTITSSRERSAAYLATLEKEMDAALRLLHPDRQVVQIHLGGGTPTFCPPDQLRRLGEAIHTRFRVRPDAEAGVEADPRRLTRDHLAALREFGFNRVSIGVQDHNPQVQKAVHRIQPREVTARAVAWARELGFHSLNIDLIYGLPHQTPESFAATLEDALEFRPERLAVFSYAHVPWIKPAQKIVERAALPTPETKLQLLKLSIERLAQAGYVYIGMDHFALPDDELAAAQREGRLRRNFQGYSTHGEADILGLGVSSISQIPDAYWQNKKDLEAYHAALAEGSPPYLRGFLLDREDRIRRWVIMQIMCNLGVDYGRFAAEWGARFEERFGPELESLEDLERDGLVQREPGRLRVTELGRLLIRVIAMRFDAYLPRKGPRRHAMTI